MDRENSCIPRMTFFPPRRMIFRPDLVEQKVEVQRPSGCVWMVDFDVSYPSSQFTYKDSFQRQSQWFRGETALQSTITFVLQTRGLSRDPQQTPLITVLCTAGEQRVAQTSEESWIRCYPIHPWVLWIPWIGGVSLVILLLGLWGYKRSQKKKIVQFVEKTFTPLSDLLELGVSIDSPITVLLGEELLKETLTGLQQNFSGSVAKDAAFWEAISMHLSPVLPQRVLRFAAEKQFAGILHLISRFRKKFLGKI